MIDREENPSYVNSFLDYSITILNKSSNSVKEYNYDLLMFLRFIKQHFNMTNEEDFKNIKIDDISLDTIKKITLDDIHAFLAFLVKEFNSKATTRARKVSTIRIFFKYLCQHAKLIDKNPALYLETPKLEKRLPKYLSLDDSKKLLNATYNEDNRNYARDYAIITLFLNCGIRLSELVGININDIDFSENKLNVIGKGNKERTIYLNKACMNALSEYLSVRPKQGIKHDKKNSALDPLSVSFTPQKSSGPGIHQCQLYRQFSRPGLGRHPRRHQSHAGTIRSGRGTPRPKFSAVRSSPYCQQRNVYIFDPEYFLPPADSCQSHRLPEPIWKRQPCLHRRPCHPCHRHQHPCLYHFL